MWCRAREEAHSSVEAPLLGASSSGDPHEELGSPAARKLWRQASSIIIDSNGTVIIPLSPDYLEYGSDKPFQALYRYKR